MQQVFLQVIEPSSGTGGTGGAATANGSEVAAPIGGTGGASGAVTVSNLGAMTGNLIISSGLGGSGGSQDAFDNTGGAGGASDGRAVCCEFGRALCLLKDPRSMTRTRPMDDHLKKLSVKLTKVQNE
jgi:hypothetical protein